MDAAVEEGITNVGDVGTAARQQPRVFAPDDSLAEYAHGPRH
jgi:hypothetical protein